MDEAEKKAWLVKYLRDAADSIEQGEIHVSDFTMQRTIETCKEYFRMEIDLPRDLTSG